MESSGFGTWMNRLLPLTEPPGLIGVDGQHRHIAHQLQALAQHILHGLMSLGLSS